jgi:hypothetical protein
MTGIAAARAVAATAVAFAAVLAVTTSASDEHGSPHRCCAGERSHSRRPRPAGMSPHVSARTRLDGPNRTTTARIHSPAQPRRSSAARLGLHTLW